MAVVDGKAGAITKAEIAPYSKVSKGYMFFRKGDLLVLKSSGPHQRVISGRTALFEGKEKKVFFSNFLFRPKVDRTEVGCKIIM